MSRFQFKSHWSYKEPGRSQLGWKRKSIDGNAEVAEMLGLNGKDLKAAIIKMPQWATASVIETNGKVESLS